MKIMQYSYNYEQKEYDYIMSSVILNQKEKKCFEYLIKGLSCKEIADLLNISERTVQNRRKSIYSKLEEAKIPKLEDKDLPKVVMQIYMLIFPNGKVYIGKATDPKKRWNNGKGYRQNTEMYADIQKYGWENIDKKILYNNLSIDQAREKENETIVIYKSFMPEYGYNKQIISS